MDKEPGGAAGEVSPSVIITMAEPPLACVAWSSFSQHYVPLSLGDRVWGEPWGHGSHPVPCHTHVTCSHPPLLAGSWASCSTRQPRWHGGESVLSLLAGCPHCTVPGAALSRAEPAFNSTCSAPGQFTATAGEAHVPTTCPAWLAAVLTALSAVPCRVSRDTTTTRTPGCSGWAPAIASSPSGSARYSPRQEGGPGSTGMFQPYSLWLLCQSTPSAFQVACPL